MDHVIQLVGKLMDSGLAYLVSCFGFHTDVDIRVFSPSNLQDGKAGEIGGILLLVLLDFRGQLSANFCCQSSSIEHASLLLADFHVGYL